MPLETMNAAWVEVQDNNGMWIMVRDYWGEPTEEVDDEDGEEGERGDS